ncbi:MAG: gliding motility-associated C-terminal domain-containing protein, partial [Bacteroidota bacterium]|nr:gliding motility-associated C-terminal domain-containing protein [Bacteroidota bacterium]
GVITNSLNPTTTVSGLAVGNNVLVWTIVAAGTCSTTSSSMTIQVDQLPTTSLAGPSQTICISNPNYTMTGNTPLIGNGIWTIILSPGAITTPNSPTTTVTGLGLNQNIFAWTITNGVCGPSTSNVIITVDPLPSAAMAGSNQTICINNPTTTLNGNSPAVGTGTWSVISGSGTITSVNNPTTTITNLGQGLNVIQWAIGTVGCAPTTSTLSIQVDAMPNIVSAGPNYTLCINNPTVVVTAITPTSGVGTWSVASGGGVITPSTNPTTSITSLPVGTNIMQWTVVNGVCPAVSSTMSIQVDNNTVFASAGPNQTLCASSPSTTLSGNTATVGVGTWAVLVGSGSITTPSLSNTTVTSLGTGTNILQWTIVNGVCSFNSSIVYIYVIPSPGTPTATASQTLLCINSPTTIVSANSPTLGTASWSVVSGSANILTPLSNTSTVINLGLGNNVLAWTMTYSVCSLTSTVNIQVDNIPSLSNAGPSQTICLSNPNATLAANTPTSGIGTWSLISGGGTITTPTLANTTVTGLPIGLNVFQWNINGGACGTTTSTMSIQVDNIPTAASAGPNQTLCINNPTTTLSGNSPAIGIGTWSIIIGSGTISTPTLATTSVTGMGVGLNTLRWTISNGVCSSSSTVNIQVDNAPSTSLAGSNQSLCINSPSTTLTGNPPTVGLGTWSVISGGGSITTPTLATSSVTSLSLGLNVLEWTITNASCGSNSSTMSIQVDPATSIALAGPSQTLCESNPTTTLAANTPTTGVGSWSVVIGSGILTNSLSPNTTVTSLSTGINVLEWTITSIGTCSTSSSTMTIQVDQAASIAAAGPNQTVCATNPNTTLAANTPTSGLGTWSVISGGGIITNSLSPNSTVTGLTVGTNILEWTIVSAGSCSVSNSTMTIQVDPAASVASAGSNQTLCISNPTTVLSGNSPIVGIGTWSVIVGSGVITTPTLATSSVTGLLSGINILEWTVTNGACANSSTVSIQVDNTPSISNAGSNQTICATTSSTTLNGNVPTVGVGTWSVLSGLGSITTQTLATSTITGLTSGLTILEWSITNGLCGTSTSTTSIQVDLAASISSAGPNQTLCVTTPSTSLVGNTPTVGVGTWSVIVGGGSITTPTLGTTNVTSLLPGINTLEWTITNGACSSTSTVNIQVDNLPTTSVAGPNQTVCINSPSVTMGAVNATIGTGSWSVVSGSGTIANVNLATTSITNLAIGDNVFAWTISNNCGSSTSTVSIFVDQIPSIASAGIDQNYCTTTAAVLNGNSPTIGLGNWIVISGGSSVTTPTLNSSSVTGLTTGTNSLVWMITNGSCNASTDTVKIIIDAMPTIANAGIDQSSCSTATVLNANTPFIGTGFWSVIGGGSSVTNPTINNSGVTSLSTPTNLLVWTISNGICPASKDTVMITLLPPTILAAAGNDTIIYSNQINLNGNNPTSGFGIWTFASGTGNISNPNSYNTLVNNIKPGLNTLIWTITDVCGITQDDINITLIDVEFPNGISPNGDGVNDYFEIPFIASYSKVEIKIVNRWGNLVYEDLNYNNNWNGINQTGNPLAEDTYFYVLNLDNIIKTGYITIKR